MTTETDNLNVRVAEAMGIKLFVIYSQRNDAFYRENAHGYTGSIAEAWKVTAEQGRKYELYADSKPGDRAYGERVVLKPVPRISYATDLNAAMTLCERLRGEGWRWHAFNFDDGMVACVFFKTEDGWQTPQIAPTLALAIAKAFLAVRDSQKSPLDESAKTA